MNKRINLVLILAVAMTSAFAQINLKTGLKSENMDLTQNPGENFYEYANGGWVKAHPLSPEYARFGTFNELDELNRKRIKELIQELALERHEKGSIGQKIADLFNLAMDSARRNREGNTPVMKEYKNILAISSREAWLVNAALLGRQGVGNFIGVYVGADDKNSSQNIVNIFQSGLTLGQKDYYLENDSATQKIREAYKKYIVTLFKLMGESCDVAQANMETVLRVETAVAKISRSRTELRDPQKNYNKMTYVELLQKYPAIDWNLFFRTLGYPAFNEVIVGQPEFIEGVSKLFRETSLDDLKTYMAFQLLTDASGLLSDDFRNANFDFFGRVMSGKEEDTPLWKRSVSTVNSVLGEAVGKMYTEKYFPAAAKERMTQLVKNLQVALGERIDAQKWMSKETKQRAHEKLSTFYVKIGYPNKWKNYDKLDIDPSLSYYDNLQRASIFAMEDMIQKKVNKPVDRDEWYMTPQTVNAYYNPTTNEICFPAGILQYPFFDMEADDAFNYGAIGVVIGHEMTHGFDDNGRQYDKDGNLKDWWTPADAEGFKARAKVLSDFFSNINVLPDLKANGELTLGENLADHGGLNVSFKAFQNAMKSNPLKKVDGLTPEQRFFIAYAGVWAGNIRDEEIRNLTKRDPHALGLWRVNGALPHIDAWYKAFNVTKKNKLFLPKEKRVQVW